MRGGPIRSKGITLFLNSKLLFNGNQLQNIYKRRKDFLKALSLELVTEYHHIRSTTKSFSKPLRSIFQKHAIEDIPEPLLKAKKRCHLCSYKKDRKTKPLCQKYQKNVCKEHSIIMCRLCIITSLIRHTQIQHSTIIRPYSDVPTSGLSNKNRNSTLSIIRQFQ
ncbi:hypothetical protein LAZ67_7002483 [Cordylochernes scorpioides]|uniref:PiggyBac transposable element-derived protein 4 C-terminal zinc-ribbon domain-containing protein n=1 Tax=Cordylochernes scorpioides TaxID=51811 RepID=A0ABY6KNC0_9ARAC|nr:hypothetical protein LAZ67_7002483 [Cordylochernes scorpioides]